MTTILRIDGSAKTEGSVTRDLTDQLIARLLESNPDARVVTRDLLAGIPLLDNTATTAIGAAEGDRTDAQVQSLELSDDLIEEFIAADIVVLGSPMYNFSIPAAVKAYIDQITRAGRTFKYGEQGPVGLVPDRPTYIVSATGGTPVAGELDFATPYLRQILGFIGIADVSIIAADMLMIDAEAALSRAHQQMDAALALRIPA